MNQLTRTFWVLAAGCFVAVSFFAQTSTPTPVPPSTLGLENGFSEFETSEFKIKLVKQSQTLAALEPNGANGFDFTPADRLSIRARDGFYHFGDIKFTLKTDGGEWVDYSTASSRKPVLPLTVQAPDIARSDLSASLPADCPIRVIRTWTVRDGKFVLNFELINKTDKPIEIGELGIPMVFNNIITNRKLPEAHEKNSFSDPYIGLDAGYIQVTRLKGNGPALVVVPEGKTPFEAYQPLREPARPQQTAEGMFEWVVRSKALAENEWSRSEMPTIGNELFDLILFLGHSDNLKENSLKRLNISPWNPPTSEILAPKAKREIGVRFLLSDKIQNIEETLKANKRPVAVGIPGYVLPNDIEGKLFLKAPSKVTTVEVEPTDSMTVTAAKAPKSDLQAFAIKSNGWGRSRLTISYADGTRQTIQYYLTKPSRQAVADLGNFLFTKQWYENPSDPFKRSPSVMGYDREADKIVEQDQRVWIAGLGDEGGGGSWVAAAMKQLVEPKAEEIAKFERFIDGVIWGGLQYMDGQNKYGVRKSMLYYSPDEFPAFPYEKNRNWTTWASWKKDQAMSVGRGYNYPHVVAAYWSIYRNARNTEGLVKNHSWDWYLDQAFETTKFAFSKKPDGKYVVGYVELGLMEGTIFLELLKDLKREGWTAKAAEIEKLMKERADHWAAEEYPFGSEMAWDSTGQEEVYAWCKYFGHPDKAMVSLNSIIGYMPSIPHWGYNGNARRYWDFLYAAKLTRIERQIHHYGSGLNAIPMLDHYRDDPTDEHLLRVGYAGGNAALTNIDQEGFASAAFHSYPDTLKWDAYSGDYGMNFFGHAMNAATYVANMRDFGWQAFGGNIRVNGDRVMVTPRDSMRQRIFIAPFRLWLTLDAGTFETIELNAGTRAVKITLSPATGNVKTARLRIENAPYGIDPSFKSERGAYSIPLDGKSKKIELTDQSDRIPVPKQRPKR
ncbi:MAG: hypothetical protein IPG22_12635 [Acidobacteria bacterium]|nr:hypothetical protein [Acidobacteriota bacterium]